MGLPSSSKRNRSVCRSYCRCCRRRRHCRRPRNQPVVPVVPARFACNARSTPRANRRGAPRDCRARLAASVLRRRRCDVICLPLYTPDVTTYDYNYLKALVYTWARTTARQLYLPRKWHVIYVLIHVNARHRQLLQSTCRNISDIRTLLLLLLLCCGVVCRVARAPVRSTDDDLKNCTSFRVLHDINRLHGRCSCDLVSTPPKKNAMYNQRPDVNPNDH